MGQSGSHTSRDIMADNPEIWKAAAMADQFEKIQKLPDPVVGAPNFHRIPGYKVYCTGQPTSQGFKNILEKVTGKIYPKEGKIIWLNLRQEPGVYVNGQPICARPPNKIGEYAELGAVTRDMDEADFDTICQTLVGSSINTPVIVNDQVGLSRATTGCVIACLFKEFQINASFEGLVETVPGMNLDLLKMDKYTMDPAKDALFRGEFPVVMEMIGKIKDGVGAKNELDKVVDKNGAPKTGGNGIKQLRENIAESKLSYEIMDDAAQAFLKVKIMDNIHKYYYLILFTAYMREAADLARNAVADDQKAALTLTSGKCAIPGDQLNFQGHSPPSWKRTLE